jgi:hypothetical protein
VTYRILFADGSVSHPYGHRCVALGDARAWRDYWRDNYRRVDRDRYLPVALLNVHSRERSVLL